MAWKKLSKVICMEEVPAGNVRRTVLGLKVNQKFNQVALKFSFKDPNEEEEDRVSKVKPYWEVRDQERLHRKLHFRELKDAEGL
ncbi:hypothetical protein M422DRAFT_259017 [Sphaerobolus stellatus SS14]|uniref:Uncharacterized protein n=1 Tax=Sphaerobolus stellatus (strain SS14) TaxID=990650 RepID=A0A0C9VLD8_SPHS4|nr:hypothetical protein M422DRAFT_259017 [Sphaerobolus stellatus SS14]